MSKTQEISDGEKTPVSANKHRLFNSMLLATDFSSASDRALEYAASLARRYCSMVYLTHIITVDVSMANCYFAKPHGVQHCYIPFSMLLI